MNLQWSVSLAVGVSVIDDQHMELFSRFNRLLNALTHGNGKEELVNVVKFLEDYVVTHFGMEEKVMERYAYPAISAHKAQHSIFTTEFASFKKDLATSGFSRQLAIDILEKMGEWLVNHVGETDRNLGKFLQVAMMIRKTA